MLPENSILQFLPEQLEEFSFLNFRCVCVVLFNIIWAFKLFSVVCVCGGCLLGEVCVADRISVWMRRRKPEGKKLSLNFRFFSSAKFFALCVGVCDFCSFLANVIYMECDNIGNNCLFRCQCDNVL